MEVLTRVFLKKHDFKSCIINFLLRYLWLTNSKIKEDENKV